MFGVVRVMSVMSVMRTVRVVLPSRCATGLAKKREVRRSCHVCRGEECATEANSHKERVAIGANIVNDFVFGEKARERKHPAQGQRRHCP